MAFAISIMAPFITNLRALLALILAGHYFCPSIPLLLSTFNDLLGQYVLVMMKTINNTEK